jgi:hypothetical protein
MDLDLWIDLLTTTSVKSHLGVEVASTARRVVEGIG